MSQALHDQFPQSDYSQWISHVSKELKRSAEEVEKTLLWQTHDGLSIKPISFPTSMEKNWLPMDAVRFPKGWVSSHTLPFSDLSDESLTKKMETLHTAGCEQIYLETSTITDLTRLATLQVWMGGLAPRYGRVPRLSLLLRIPIQTLCDSFRQIQEVIRMPHIHSLCALIDPNTLRESVPSFFEWVSLSEKCTLRVSVLEAHRRGADEIEESALRLSVARMLIDSPEASLRLSSETIVYEVFSHHRLYFDIAVLRAERLLHVLLHHLSPAASVAHSEQRMSPVFSFMIDEIYYSRFDVYNNLLRSSLKGFAGAVGGASEIMIPPYDTLLPSSSDASDRLSITLQHVLKDESFLGDVRDPLRGSYFIEELTSHLAELIWERFRLIESEGGVAKLHENSAHHQRVEAQRKATELLYRTRKKTLVGVSKYVNLSEAPPPADMKSDGIYPAGLFESVRYGVLKSTVAQGQPLRFSLILFGDVQRRRARAAFSEEVLSLFNIDAYRTELEDSGSIPREAVTSADAVILCSDDAQYEDFMRLHTSFLGTAKLLFIAGKPRSDELLTRLKHLGVTDFLYLGMAVPDFFKRYLPQLGVPID